MEDKTAAPEVLTTADVAKLLQLSVKTVGDMIRNGELPAMRIGGVWRVRRESLEEWMRKREQSHALTKDDLTAPVKVE